MPLTNNNTPIDNNLQPTNVDSCMYQSFVPSGYSSTNYSIPTLQYNNSVTIPTELAQGNFDVSSYFKDIRQEYDTQQNSLMQNNFDIKEFNINLNLNTDKITSNQNSLLQNDSAFIISQIIDFALDFDQEISGTRYNKKDKIQSIIDIINISNNENEYLPKKANCDISFLRDIRQQNTEFLSSLLVTNKDLQENFTPRQKNLLEKIDKCFFPKTFCKNTNFLIDKQMEKYCSSLIDIKRKYNQEQFYYIPVFIPKYINKTNIPNHLFTIAKLIKICQLKVKYVTFRKLLEANKNLDNEFLLTCAEKINISEPTILILISDHFLNENMEMQEILEKYAMKFFEYDKILDYNDIFTYGCYKISVPNKEYFNCVLNYFSGTKATNQGLNSYGTTSDHIVKKLNFYERLKATDNLIKEKFLVRPRTILEEFINNQTQYIFNNYKQSNTYNQHKINLLNKLKKLQHSCYLRKTKKTNITRKFTEILSNINQKFEKEKLEKTYDVERLINSSCFFNTHSFGKYFHNNILQNIENNIDKDISKFENFNNFKNEVSIYVLIPCKYNLNAACTAESILEKRLGLLNAQVKKYHFACFFKSKNVDINNNKIIIALTEEMNINNGYNDSDIILCLPQAFDKNCKPLFDINKFTVNGYFYDVVDKKIAGYPLYTLKINPALNVSFQSRDSTKVDYLYQLPDLSELTLEEYLKYSYSIVYSRAKKRAEKIQSA